MTSPHGAQLKDVPVRVAEVDAASAAPPVDLPVLQ